MATIERFIGPLGAGKDSDVHALLDYRESPSYPSYSATGGYGNGKSIRSGGFYYYSINCSTAKTKVVGAWMRGTAFYNYNSSINSNLLYFNGPAIRICNTSAGFDIRRDSTQIATSDQKVTSDLTHVEVKVYSHASEGTVEIKLNGSLVVQKTGLNTGGQDITGISFGTCSNPNHYNSGIFIADDWVCPLIPKLLIPDGDSTKQLTPKSGSDNYAMVNETAQDGDTTYVESDTNGKKDIYTFSDLDAGFIPVVASVVMVAKEVDGGGKKFKVLAEQDSTEYEIGSINLSAAYPAAVGAGQYVTLSKCPDDTAWSRTKLNDMKFGVKVA